MSSIDALLRSEGRQKKIGRRIKEVRKNAGLTQDEFGRALEVSRGAVGNWELGKGIKTTNLAAIAQVFGGSVEMFFDDFQEERQIDSDAPPIGQARNAVANWFNEVLDTSGHSQSSLARVIGLNQSKISRIASGDRQISAAEMVAISAATGYPLAKALESARAQADGDLREDWREVLRDAASGSGKSLRQISLGAGLGPNFVSQLLEGEKAPSIENVCAICDELEITFGSLMNVYLDQVSVKKAVKAAFAALEALEKPITAESVGELAAQLCEFSSRKPI